LRPRKTPQSKRFAIWEDRIDNARPTAQRLQKGVFVLRDTEDAGVRHAVDTAAHPLDVMRQNGTLTEEQATAGFDMANLIAMTRMVSQGRSCLDFSPVGHDGNLSDNAQAGSDRTRLYSDMGQARWAECYRVCAEGRRPSNMAVLRDGLDVCVKFFKGS
jgi:hypothetical protein